MVCKEDVLSWFKDLESYKRIDVMYELLNMCIPFELRFLGSCVEEIGKHTYQELRGPALQANDLEKLQKDISINGGGIFDENVRHRLLIYLSLLSSRNYSVANWMCKTLLRTERIEDYIVKGNIKDDNTQSEFLLLYVMALHHPAFTFEQKLFFGKIVALLIDSKEKNRSSPKPTPYGYPPGFGYPTAKLHMSTDPPPPNIPVKISSAMPCGEAEIIHQQPPTFNYGPPPTQEFIAWSRPGFPCGAPPESVPPPFSGPNMSPLVSQSTSPIHSRSSSPHRTIATIRSTPMPPPPQPPAGASTVPPPPPPPSCDPLPTTLSLPLPVELSSINNFPTFIYATENQIKLPPQPLDDECLLFLLYGSVWCKALLYGADITKSTITKFCMKLNSIPEDKLVGDVTCWLSKDLKQTNGLRFHHHHPNHHHHHHPHLSKPHRGCYVIDQIQSLSLDGNFVDGCLQRSNSSSNSSLNQTPPETPTTTCRGNSGEITISNKPRCNGMPPPPPPPPPTSSVTPMLGPMCEPASPPPSHTFNNSVPYTTYPTTFTAMPTRNMFPPYNTQSYRSPFTTHFPSYQNENSFPNATYSLPYPSYALYSGAYQQQPTRNLNCYNCGAMGHLGADCTGQNIEDITQKKTYTLEYAPTLPDSDK